MVLRKPYAFFIKMFKPLHIMLGLLITYLIYMQNRILIYFNNYIHSNNGVTSFDINNLIYVIPFILIVFCIGIFIVMSKKNKPIKFYIISVLLFIGIIIINVFVNGFINQLHNGIIPVSKIKVARDLSLINIGTEITLFIFFLIRGLGINIRKFDFSSDLLNLDINEEDKEEIEVSINIDSDSRRRNRKSKIRNLKYIYLENKAFYNILFITTVLVLIGLGFLIYGMTDEIEKTNYVYSSNGFSFKVNNSYIVDKGYKGNDIDNLIVLDVSMLSYNSKSIDLNDFSLLIEDVTFKPITKYSSSLIDIGMSYIDEILSDSYNDYLIVFDVPEKYLKSKIVLKYVGTSDTVKIRVKPGRLIADNKTISYNIGDEVDMSESLGNIKFKITEFDIQNNYVIEYNYCHNGFCALSKEYLKPSINEKFDKAIIRLKAEFTNNSKLNIADFYELFSRFGSIKYGDNVQNSNFEEILSTKKNTGYIYIGVNKDIINTNNIKLIFNIRNTSIEYTLRGES